MRITHITPHLGGGVGRVVLSWTKRAMEITGEEHEILCLEDANPASIKAAAESSIPLLDLMDLKIDQLSEKIEQTDIVVMHWWNHPRLYNLMVNKLLPPCRLILWSHVSGIYPPHSFTDRLLEFPDRFIVSTPFSFESDVIVELDPGKRDRLGLVFTCAGTERVSDVQPVQHEGLVVGYIGTVDFCKMHPLFVKMSAAVRIPDVRFVVCGGNMQDQLREQAVKLGAEDRFVFTGPVDNIKDYLSTFDVFGYPLRPDHYGTGEQALIEAMAAGLPVVAFSHGAESHLVENGRTGIKVKWETEYIQALEILLSNASLRKQLGQNAKKAAMERFDLDKMVRSWSDQFCNLFKSSKKIHRWSTTGKLTGAQLYIESLGEAAEHFRKSVSCTGKEKEEAELAISRLDGCFRSMTRGSPFHYRSVFNDDPYLENWCRLLENHGGDHEL